MLKELKTLRGKEGAADYAELVFTRSNSGGADTGDGKSNLSAGWSPEAIGKLHLESGVDVQCPARLELQGEGGGGSGGDGVDAASAFLACLRTDRSDGLFTTVVCDTMGVALGLVREGAGRRWWLL